MRTGKELVTGIPNFNTGTQDGITIFESFYQIALDKLDIEKGENLSDFCKRAIDFAKIMIDELNKGS